MNNNTSHIELQAICNNLVCYYIYVLLIDAQAYPALTVNTDFHSQPSCRPTLPIPFLQQPSQDSLAWEHRSLGAEMARAT